MAFAKHLNFGAASLSHVGEESAKPAKPIHLNTVGHHAVCICYACSYNEGRSVHQIAHGITLARSDPGYC
jgi:hypothetical protein